MRRSAIATTLAVTLLLPLAGMAQEAAPAMPTDPRAARFNEVERGFFMGFEVGYLRLFKTPTADQVKFQTAGTEGGPANGMVVGVNMGYDISPHVALSLFALGASERAGPSYGAFDVFVGGADLRVSPLAIRDSYGVRRLYVYVHGRAGFLMTSPDGLFGTNDVYLAGGPGLEYFTHLRHFSVGLAVDLGYVSKASTMGLAITPTIRYTF